MTDTLKKLAAKQALQHIKPGIKLGIGTGSTVNYFIDALIFLKSNIDVVVSSSNASTDRLKAIGIPVANLCEVGTLDLYIDGADEIDPHLNMIKGGGAALTREKIIAEASRQFICIADPSKKVNILGKFPLPIEVIPMSKSIVARKVVELGGQPKLRENTITDNGNNIIDIYNLSITNPPELEKLINQIPGVVTCGIFARNRANQLIDGL